VEDIERVRALSDQAVRSAMRRTLDCVERLALPWAR
jgi:hypothetical protein